MAAVAPDAPAARLRQPPPPPLRIASPSRRFSAGTSRASPAKPRPSSTLGLARDHQSPTTFLYELPSSTRSPPPTSSRTPNRVFSPPLSPPAANRHGSRTSSLHHPRPINPSSHSASPPPIPRASSSTPRAPAKQELDKFAQFCHEWYYQQNALSGRIMSQTLANIHPSQRATYTRLQASIRSAFHADQSLRRVSEFRAVLASTQPGHSLSIASRNDPSSPRAKKERAEKVQKFIHTQCLAGVPGTHPFFLGLYGALRLQTLPENLGGAGEHRLKWEIDDAVFMESAGKDFTLEAVDVLKGVLGFEDMPMKKQTIHTPEQQSSTLLDTDASSDSEQEQATSTDQLRRQTLPRVNSFVPRVPSNPFLDPSRGTPPDGSESPMPTTPSDDISASTTPYTPTLTPAEYTVGDPLSSPQLRTWIAPAGLSNPEIHALVGLFPPFITQSRIPRFPVQKKKRGKDLAKELEEGLAMSEPPTDIRVGTGRMWVGTDIRLEGWKGGMWSRLRDWLRRIFS